MSKQASRRPTKQARRQDRREEILRREEERRRAARRTRITIIGIVAAIALFAGAIFAYARYANAQNQTPTVVNPAFPPVDSIYCDQQEQTNVHYHAHLNIYVNGKVVSVPQGVGIASDNSCLYWLHTHDNTGIIHIESPADHTFTLGNFLDEWSSQFSQLGYPSELDLSGWKVYVNGQPYTGDLHRITLKSHELITLAYNSPKIQPDTSYNWDAAGLQQ
ncbi:MAG: hypothetical protein ACJ788_20370 [Ktedonobacteraceae bacterium]